MYLFLKGGSSMITENQIQDLRYFNRFYANKLSEIDQVLYNKTYSLTESRVIAELHYQEQATSKTLSETLNIDPGFLSRIIKKFENDEIIKKEQSKDKRQPLIKLTEQGINVFQNLEQKAQSHLKEEYKDLNKYELDTLIESQKRIIKLNNKKQNTNIKIRPYDLGDAGYVAQLHGDFYKKNYQFDKAFDFYVLEPLTKFIYNPTGSQLWIAEINGERAGSIAIIKENNKTAQLRWFILEEKTQGLGIGNKLLETAMTFAQNKKYEHIYLWTVSLLKPARHLYKKFGFQITQTKENKEWSSQVLTEERWDLNLK